MNVMVYVAFESEGFMRPNRFLSIHLTFAGAILALYPDEPTQFRANDYYPDIWHAPEYKGMVKRMPIEGWTV